MSTKTEVEFIRDEDGKINWRKMINPKYVVLNRQMKDDVEIEYNKTFAELEELIQEDESQIDDKWKLILLAGIKEVAYLRGYSSVEYPFTHVEPGFVSKTCRITWLPHEDSDGEIHVFEDGADATKENTFSWYGSYLSAAATNRAFVRTVRNYLRIPVVGSDEVGPSKDGFFYNESATSDDGYKRPTLLERAASDLGWSFDDVKERCVKKKTDGAKDWKGFEDIPARVSFKLLAEIKKLKKA